MKYVFLIYLYLNITLISSFHRSSRYLSTTSIPIILSISQIFGLSILVKAFFIFKWYIILPIIIVFSFLPLNFLLAEFNRDLEKRRIFLLNFQNILFKNYLPLSICNILIALIAWLIF
jgi:hypothetical protein